MHVYAGRVTTISEYGDYLKKRLARMYPLHIATFLMAPFFAGLYFPDSILPNVLLIHAWDVTKHLSLNYPSWSVSAEFFVYLLFPVFYTLMIALGRFTILFPLIFALILTIAFRALGTSRLERSYIRLRVLASGSIVCRGNVGVPACDAAF